MIDNFTIIKDFIQSQFGGQFNDFTDAFYAVEIIGRKKDGASADTHKFKTYFIKNIEDLYKYEAEIKAVCDALKMRAYISVNSKSWRQVTLNTMAEYADHIAHDNFDKPQSVFESCVGKFVDRSSQLWIIDVDKEDADFHGMSIDDLAEYYSIIIEKECSPRRPIVTVIPTKTGKHIICHPFNTVEFSNKACGATCTDGLIKKNNFTLLYENVK